MDADQLGRRHAEVGADQAEGAEERGRKIGGEGNGADRGGDGEQQGGAEKGEGGAGWGGTAHGGYAESDAVKFRGFRMDVRMPVSA